MFSVVSVCQSFCLCRGGEGHVISTTTMHWTHHTGTLWPRPQVMGPHCTVTHPHAPAPAPSPAYLDMGPHCTWTPPRPDMFRLVHYKARTVGKRMVCILLECLLKY